MSRRNTHCAVCTRPTTSGRRGTYTTATGGTIYLCHGPNVKQDCYVDVSRNPELRARLTGKEVIR